MFALALLVSLPAMAEEPKKTAQPDTFMGAKVIGRVQYERQQAVKIERPALGSRGRATTTTVTVKPVAPKRVISSNELAKMSCVNGTCYDYLPAIPGAKNVVQPGPDTPQPVGPVVQYTVTTKTE